jgi:hypothetical protein
LFGKDGEFDLENAQPPRRCPASLEPALSCQGIDLKAGGRNKKVARTSPKSENVYLRLLVKV